VARLELPPKVLKVILEEGAFCDDELASEYFAGVLASSRTQNDRDDRGATYAQLVSRVSNYQIRFHYLFHCAFTRIYSGSTVNLLNGTLWSNMKLFILKSDLEAAME
jgi:hypothetical protein